MTTSRLQSVLNEVAGQVRASRPLALALPCAALSLVLLVAAIQAQAPRGPTCEELAPSAPGFDSLTLQVRPACIRIRLL